MNSTQLPADQQIILDFFDKKSKEDLLSHKVNGVTIYILKLADEKYYIGESSDPQKRISDHFNGKGSAWTEKYPPKSIVDVIFNCDSFDENKYTKIYMAQYGIENVRGGSYCRIELSDETKKLLEKELKASENKCYRCGKSGHFITRCPLKQKCARCQRTGHTKLKCYAKTTLSGKPIREIKMCSRCKREGHIVSECPLKKKCTRCQRRGHSKPECFAKTTLSGKPIGEIKTTLSGELIGETKIISSDESIGKPVGEIKMCFKCKKEGHTVLECRAKKDDNGKKITWNGCKKCGRRSHWAIRCSKKKDIFNRPVESLLSIMISSTKN